MISAVLHALPLVLGFATALVAKPYEKETLRNIAASQDGHTLTTRQTHYEGFPPPRFEFWSGKFRMRSWHNKDCFTSDHDTHWAYSNTCTHLHNKMSVLVDSSGGCNVTMYNEADCSTSGPSFRIEEPKIHGMIGNYGVDVDGPFCWTFKEYLPIRSFFISCPPEANKDSYLKLPAQAEKYGAFWPVPHSSVSNVEINYAGQDGGK